MKLLPQISPLHVHLSFHLMAILLRKWNPKTNSRRNFVLNFLIPEQSATMDTFNTFSSGMKRNWRNFFQIVSLNCTSLPWLVFASEREWQLFWILQSIITQSTYSNHVTKIVEDKASISNDQWRLAIGLYSYWLLTDDMFCPGWKFQAQKRKCSTYSIYFVPNKHLNAILISGVEINFFSPHIRQVCKGFPSCHIVHCRSIQKTMWGKWDRW